ncbi:uncharacterized protein LOC126910549 [Daktulosphaira vitifoliae]|uniref:uncharacterized protein LOC126910549 n=1 Tax=Daktulosphaira vitifoliae TaxID=58002 RepID=UPI0021A99ECF|nr:uncharacterized protein LOC126910549 [Daktulosphaira vitifoliae]
MEKTLVLLLMLACSSHQRPQIDVKVSTTTEQTDNNEDVENNANLHVPETTAVSVESSVNVSSIRPSEVFENFLPSNYYKPNENPIFEKPSPHIKGEVFYRPSYFNRPPNRFTYQLTRNKENGIISPQATQEYYSESNYNKSLQLESKSPAKYGEILPQFKPMKHDFGEYVPNYTPKLNVGNYHNDEMLHYPDETYESPIHNYHSQIKRKINPWSSVVTVLASLLPIGLLFASLPPTIIRVNSTQNSYQLPKNSSINYQNNYTGKYKSLDKKIASRKSNEVEVKFLKELDECSKRKLCENMKKNYSSSELENMLQYNIHNNSTEQYTDIIKTLIKSATSGLENSCQVFNCQK